MNAEFEAFKVHREPKTLIVIPQGDSHGLRYDSLFEEHASLQSILKEPDIVNLLVDLESVEFLGSIMLGVILKLSRTVSEKGGTIVLCSASEQMQRVLESQNLSGIWPHFPTREQALESLAG